MPDDFEDDRPNGEELRYTLRNVVAYKMVCEQVRSASTGSLIFGAIMLALWYWLIPEAQKYKPFSLIYLALGAMEFCTGLYNRVLPAPEGILIDGLLLLAFTASTIAQLVLLQRFSPFQVLAIFWAMQGVRHIRSYFQIRRAIPIRPTRSDLRWFNELIADVRSADPVEDDQALDLPTEPPFRAKLLGDSAFFLTPGNNQLLIFSRDDVEIVRKPKTDSEETPKASLMLDGDRIGTFALDAENWRNYTKWKSAE